MKHKYVAMILSAMLAASMITGCASSAANTSASTESSSEMTSSETVYGEVTAVTDSAITVDIGTLSDESDTSAFEKTGESAEITVTDNTEFTLAGMGGGQGGQAPSDQNGQGGQAPSDQNGQDGQAPSDQNGQGGQAPSDQNGQGGQAPSDQAGSSETGNAEGTAASDDGLTELPNGQAGDSGDSDQEMTELPGSKGGMVSGNSGSEGQGMPEKPDGENGSGQPGDMTIDISSISVGDLISVTFDDSGDAAQITILSSASMGGSGQGGGASQTSADIEYTAVKTCDQDTEIDGETLESTGSDENALLVESGTTSLTGVTVSRDSDDSTGGDNSSFYGVGAALLATGGTLKISDAEITTDAAGGAGVFAYGDSTVYVSDTTISTKQDTSGGIHAAGGGTLYATNVTATTEGNSSAAIRSDRGGGTMIVDGGSYTSNGSGSPAIYSTADIAVRDADLTANGSEAICIEGLNSVHLYDCNLTGNMSDDSQNDCTWNVILYQSMSGDAEEGNSTFEMDGGTLTAKNGGMFYTTNTESTFILDDVDITYAKDNDFFLRCTGNSNARGWGSSGSNGADCSFTAIDQEMEGDIIWDSISKLDFYMTGASTLTGAVVDDESDAGDGGDGYCTLNIEKGSTWIVTGDSSLTTLNNEGTIKDADGNTVTIKGTDGTVYVKGESDYTITVTNYSTSCDTSEAGAATTFESCTSELTEK